MWEDQEIASYFPCHFRPVSYTSPNLIFFIRRNTTSRANSYSNTSVLAHHRSNGSGNGSGGGGGGAGVNGRVGVGVGGYQRQSSMQQQQQRKERVNAAMR